jgi:hypothetical protein
MTPHLARLFEQSKISAKRNTVADDVQQDALFRLQSLFRDHGEALVEALGRIRTIARHQDTNVLDPFKWLIQISEEAERVLAAMEREAG